MSKCGAEARAPRHPVTAHSATASLWVSLYVYLLALLAPRSSRLSRPSLLTHVTPPVSQLRSAHPDLASRPPSPRLASQPPRRSLASSLRPASLSSPSPLPLHSVALAARLPPFPPHAAIPASRLASTAQRVRDGVHIHPLPHTTPSALKAHVTHIHEAHMHIRATPDTTHGTHHGTRPRPRHSLSSGGARGVSAPRRTPDRTFSAQSGRRGPDPQGCPR